MRRRQIPGSLAYWCEWSEKRSSAWAAHGSNLVKMNAAIGWPCAEVWWRVAIFREERFSRRTCWPSSDRQQGSRPRLAKIAERAGHVSLAVLGFAVQRIGQHVGVGEARLVPRHPLHEVVLRVRRGHAVRRLQRFHDFLAE